MRTADVGVGGLEDAGADGRGEGDDGRDGSTGGALGAAVSSTSDTGGGGRNGGADVRSGGVIEASLANGRFGRAGTGELRVEVAGDGGDGGDGGGGGGACRATGTGGGGFFGSGGGATRARVLGDTPETRTPVSAEGGGSGSVSATAITADVGFVGASSTGKRDERFPLRMSTAFRVRRGPFPSGIALSPFPTRANEHTPLTRRGRIAKLPRVRPSRVA